MDVSPPVLVRNGRPPDIATPAHYKDGLFCHAFILSPVRKSEPNSGSLNSSSEYARDVK